MSFELDVEMFRRRLAAALELNGRSQAALAKKLGVHQSAVSRMLAGTRRLKVEEIAKIDQYLAETEPKVPWRLVVAESSEDDLGGGLADIADNIGDRMAAPGGVEAFLPVGVENEYEFVLRVTANLSLSLQACVVATSKATQDDELIDLADKSWRLNTVRKVAALVRVGRLMAHDSDRLLTLIGIRDVFVHSPARVSLLDPPLCDRLYRAMKLDPPAERTAEALRHLFAFAATFVALRLQHPDEAEAVKLLRDIADELSEM